MEKDKLIGQYLFDSIEVKEDDTPRELILVPDLGLYDRNSQLRRLQAGKFLPYAGTEISEKDFPSSVEPILSRNILHSFNADEKKKISLEATFHEVTPATQYWHESADNILPLLSQRNASLITKEGNSPETAAGHMSDLALVISRRCRRASDLRGDKECLEALGALLLAPELCLPDNDRVNLASHYFAHARIAQRSERQFAIVADRAPESAKRSCQIAQRLHLEPEMISDLLYCQSLTRDQFQSTMRYRQGDILDHASYMRNESRNRNRPCTKSVDCNMRDRISATRMMVEKAHSDGILSPSMSKANSAIFCVGNDAKCGALILIAPEISRSERVLEHQNSQELKRRLKQTDIQA